MICACNASYGQDTTARSPLAGTTVPVDARVGKVQLVWAAVLQPGRRRGRAAYRVRHDPARPHGIEGSSLFPHLDARS